MLRIMDIKEWFILISLLIIMVCGGGIVWYHCILPLLLILLLIILSKKWNNKIDSLHIMTFVLVVISLISTVMSYTNKMTSLNECIKILFIWSMYSVGRNMKNNRKIDLLIFSTSGLLAFIGILSYCNILNLADGVFYVSDLKRLQSTLGYANTTACLLGCGYFSFLNIYNRSDTFRWIYSYIATFILTAFILTFSKGTIAITLFLFAVFGVVFKDKFLKLFTHIVMCTGTAFLVTLLCSKNLHILGFVVLLFVAYLISNIYTKRLVDFNIKYIPVITFVCACICLLGGIIYICINPDDFSTFTTRLDYMRDALRLLKENILFGIGPGAWNVMQYKIQQTDYSVSYIHNGWLQFWVEYGIIFFGIFIACCIKSIKDFVLSIKKNPENTVRFFFLILLLLHSLIDFDFGYGITLAFLGLLFAASQNDNESSDDGNVGVKPIKLMSAFSIMFVFVLIVEFFIQLNFEIAVENEDYATAIKYNQLQIVIFPYDSDAVSNHAAVIQKNGGDNETILMWLDKAHKLSPNDPDKIKNKIEFSLYSQSGNVLELCTQYIHMLSKSEEAYVYVDTVAGQALQLEMCTQSEYDKFIEYLTQTREEEKVIDRNELLHKFVE